MGSTPIANIGRVVYNDMARNGRGWGDDPTVRDEPSPRHPCDKPLGSAWLFSATMLEADLFLVHVWPRGIVVSLACVCVCVNVRVTVRCRKAVAPL